MAKTTSCYQVKHLLSESECERRTWDGVVIVGIN